MKIRPLKITDLYEISAMMEQAWPSHSAEGIVDLVMSFCNPKCAGYSYTNNFVAETDCGVIGFCGLYRLGKSDEGEWSATPKGFVGIDWTVVAPEFRGHGIGKLLLEHVQKQAKGFKTMFVYADNNSLNFYLKNGFQKRNIDFPAIEGSTETGITILFKDV